jgi:hypothetical protein
MVVREQALEFFRLFAQLQPIEEQIGGLQPDSEPVSDFLFFTPFLRAHAGIHRQALRSLSPFEDQRANQSSPHTVRSTPVLTIDRVQLLERRFRAFQVMKLKRTREPGRVRLLHQRIDVAVVVVDAHARLPEHVGDIGRGGPVVSSQTATELSLEGANLALPGAFQALCLAQAEDESLFAVCFRHLDPNWWWRQIFRVARPRLPALPLSLSGPQRG